MKIKKNMDEIEIRPHNLVKKLQPFLRKDIKFLQSKLPLFKKVKCPACDSDYSKKYMVKEKFNYQICKNCDTFYISPRPPLKVLKVFYKSSLTYNFFNKYIYPASEKVRLSKIFLPRVKKIIALCKKYKIKKKPTILEVGAGIGSFCYLAKKSKFFSKIKAIEPSEENVKFARKKGLDVFEGTVEKFKTKKKYDIIVNFEVLEHLHSPKFFLKSIKKYLKNNGMIFLTCPNGMGFDIQKLKKKSDSIDHEHLNYFNPKSIQILFEKNGYKIIDVSTPGQLDANIVKNKIVRKKYKIKKNDFFKKIYSDDVLVANFQEFLVQNGLSSNMLVVAKLNQKNV